MVKQRTLNFGMRNAECRIFRNLHSKIRNEKGIALVMVLVMSAIALAVMAGLIYMVITGTQISGTQKKYETAKEAGLGGTDITYEFIALRGDPATVSALLTELYAINPAVTTSSSCTGTNFRDIFYRFSGKT
jgi:hypothetical protein